MKRQHRASIEWQGKWERRGRLPRLTPQRIGETYEVRCENPLPRIGEKESGESSESAESGELKASVSRLGRLARLAGLAGLFLQPQQSFDFLFVSSDARAGVREIASDRAPFKRELIRVIADCVSGVFKQIACKHAYHIVRRSDTT